jgi:hypothetical protein
MRNLLITVALFLCVLICNVGYPQTSSSQAAADHDFGVAKGDFEVDKNPAPYGVERLFINEEVIVKASHVLVTERGMSVIFSPGTRFTTMSNAIRLEQGGTKVTTYVGLTTHLPNCYSVSPVDPTQETLYEVDWSGSSAVIYARSLNVRIRYWGGGEPDPTKNQRSADREWIVKEGQMARIGQLPSCKPLVDYWPQPNWPTGLELSAAVAGSTSTAFLDFQRKQHNMSSQGPSDEH